MTCRHCSDTGWRVSLTDDGRHAHARPCICPKRHHRTPESLERARSEARALSRSAKSSAPRPSAAKKPTDNEGE